MTRRLTQVGVAFLVIYGLLFFRLEIVQVLNANNLRDHPQNSREITLVFDKPRGSIRTADGEIVAQTVAVSSKQKRLRQYPYGPLYSHVGGFISAENGGSGLERTHNTFLAGEDLGVRIQDNRDLFIDRARTGQIEISIRHDIQLITRAAMAGHVGAAVVIDPASGSVLGLWSGPGFDPNHLSSHDLTAATTDYGVLLSDPEQPLLNRAEFQGREMGSLFTIVTAAAAIEQKLSGFVVPPSQAVTPVDDSSVITHTDGVCGGNVASLMLTGCFPGWAILGEEIGRPTLNDVSQRLGLSGTGPIRLQGSPKGVSQVARLDVSASHAAIGTGLEATPLQVAHLFATVANGGSRMQPRVVEKVLAHDGKVLQEFDPKVLRQSISKETAAELRELLAQNVSHGTAQDLSISGMEVGGMVASQFLDNHVWAVVIAPVTLPEVVVAVLLEHDSFDDHQTAGANVAAITRRITEAVLRLSSSNVGGS
ncbi:MAG: penicillin-binding transpeptidase domain-containing protein [Acidimicrobiales bacterium]|nr:penicillin-binding transpeptidase domain-containing protein [Acidimicrobiales bacterium]